MTERIRLPIQTSYSRIEVIKGVRKILGEFAERVKEDKPGALKTAKDIFDYVEGAVLRGTVLSRIDQICNEEEILLDDKQLKEAARYYLDWEANTWVPIVRRAIQHVTLKERTK
jgi:hypothetical protein